MSQIGFCDMDSQLFSSFCHTHSISCCKSCHSCTYPDCELEDLVDIIPKMEADVKQCHQMIDGLILEVSREQLLVPDWLAENRKREKFIMSVVKHHFSEIRRLVDDREKKVLQFVRDIVSDRMLAADGIERILGALSGHKNTPILHETKIPLCEIERTTDQPKSNSPAHNVDADSNMTEVGSPDELYRQTIELHQAISRSQTILRTFYEQRSVDYEVTFEKDILDSIAKLATSTCDVRLVHKPIQNFVRDYDLVVGGCRPVVKFTEMSTISDIVIATQSPNKLMTATNGGKLKKSVAMPDSPNDVCPLENEIYITHRNHENMSNISVYNLPELNVARTFTIPGGCQGITALGHRLVVTFVVDKCVRIISTTGSILTESSHGFGYPCFVAVSNNEIYVTDDANGHIVVMSADLRTVLRTILNGKIPGAGGITFCDKTIYVSCCDGTIVESTNYGKHVRKHMISCKYPCWGICFNIRNGSLIVGNSRGNSSISKFSGK